MPNVYTLANQPQVTPDLLHPRRRLAHHVRHLHRPGLNASPFHSSPSLHASSPPPKASEITLAPRSATSPTTCRSPPFNPKPPPPSAHNQRTPTAHNRLRLDTPTLSRSPRSPNADVTPKSSSKQAPRAATLHSKTPSTQNPNPSPRAHTPTQPPSPPTPANKPAPATHIHPTFPRTACVKLHLRSQLANSEASCASFARVYRNSRHTCNQPPKRFWMLCPPFFRPPTPFSATHFCANGAKMVRLINNKVVARLESKYIVTACLFTTPWS
jgi:hypothetical protein